MLAAALRSAARLAVQRILELDLGRAPRERRPADDLLTGEVHEEVVVAVAPRAPDVLQPHRRESFGRRDFGNGLRECAVDRLGELTGLEPRELRATVGQPAQSRY